MDLIRLLRIVVAAAVLVTGACGYHFSGEGKGPRPELIRLAIPIFENYSAEPRLETMFTSALRREFNMRGDLQVVPVDQAEMIFYGRIKRLSTSDIAHLKAQQTIETRITVTLDIRCEDARDGTIMWQARNMKYYEDYFQTDDPLITFENRRLALEKIAREMSLRIHDRFLSRF